MDSILSLLQTVGIFIGALFILVLVHELGHFLAAKLFKMRVERFSIGFPPRVVGFQKGDTDYCISATPLGGYVKISGMVDESMDDSFTESEPQPWEFRSKPVWQRIIVISAGVIFNIILAVVIYATMYFSYGAQHIPADKVGALYIPETSLAYDLGFQTGDELVSVNQTRPESYRFGNMISINEITKSDVTFEVLRDGQPTTIQAPGNLLDLLNENPELLSVEYALPSQISATSASSPAAEAGLQPGDQIISMDGQPVNYWMQMAELIRAAEGEIQLEVQRGDSVLTLEVTPNPDTRTIGVAPVDPIEYFGVEYVRYGLFSSIGQGMVTTVDNTVGIVQGLGRLVSGSISVRENLGGPVAIAAVTREATDRGGWVGFWMFTAMLSITLAIMNILPIPVLDGGHLVFLIYEGITRREPSVKVRMALQQVGMILIIGLMIFVTFNDIMRFIGG
ncbi:MAG TPA: RIP metalloprotease RseP [Bacteroidetes bacterium]|nr:RIP metalloprotease RseP [Bacteroidota bacterium]